MSNEYYERKAEFKPFTTARSDDVRGEFDGIQSGFEKLPTPRQDGTKGFITAFTIVTPTEASHPATKAMVDTENSKNTEQDGRLDQVENTLSGLGPVNGRYTTLRYVATEGQDTIVLPAQFGSLAYVFVNGARKFQMVHFVYDVNTKTLTFLSALSLNDEVLVDVGVVPDAVLADLIAIQNDIDSKHSDVVSKHQSVIDAYNAVEIIQTDVTQKQTDVSQKHSDVTMIASNFGDLDTLKTSIEQSEATATQKATESADSASVAQTSANSASDSADVALNAAAYVSGINGTFPIYDDTVVYSYGQIVNRQINGVWKLFEWYSNVESLAGKDPLNTANRRIGWTDVTKPYYWKPYIPKVAGETMYWDTDAIPENMVVGIGQQLPVAVYHSLATAKPEWIDETDNTLINIPDRQGRFVRAADGATWLAGETHEDAIRNITGTLAFDAVAFSLSGVFGDAATGASSGQTTGSSASVVTFDASLVVPTADENQPKAFIEWVGYAL